MPSTLANFTSAAVAAPDDFIVGYDTATLNGERRWTVSTIANAVSGIMDEQLTTLSTPTGIVAYFAGTDVASPTAPSGWAIANGFAVTTALGSSYTELRNILISSGNPYGVSGSNPLAPDLRGIFIRGNGSQTIDSITYNKTFADKETDSLESHLHFSFAAVAGAEGSLVASGTQPTYSSNNDGREDYTIGGTTTSATVGRTSTTGGSTETRPANITLLPCIKL